MAHAQMAGLHAMVTAVADLLVCRCMASSQQQHCPQTQTRTSLNAKQNVMPSRTSSEQIGFGRGLRACASMPAGRLTGSRW